MWEQIRANKRKSVLLVGGMAGLLFGLGFVIGEFVAAGAGIFGLTVALGIWGILSLVSYFQGDSILLAVSGAREIEKQDHPQLFNVVEEMTIASGLPKMPRVFIIDDMAMNAFATGRKPENAAVAVTAGLLGKLNRDQLQGVVAHEVAHVLNRDVLLMTMAGIMLGSIVIVSEGFLRTLRFGGGSSRRYRSSRNGGGQGAAVVAILALVLAILAPIFAQLIYFAISRRREYLADASAARFTRYPEGLASALELLAGDTQVLRNANRATAPMYIINPLHRAGAVAFNATATHPPITERVRILRSMGGSAAYDAYQAAWRQISGRNAGQLPGSALAARDEAPIRTASAEPEKAGRQQFRDAGDLLRKANQFLFLPCVCGARIKLPPEFTEDHVQCPRCTRALQVPVAQVAAATQIAEMVGQHAKPRAAESGHGTRGLAPNASLEITHHAGTWESFRCTCGHGLTLSPAFAAPHTRCTQCGRQIAVNLV
jgi:heat shock protein HtpX